MNLIEAVMQFYGDENICLDDGAQNWCPETLKSELCTDWDEDGEYAQYDYVIDDSGIYRLNDNGYIDTIPCFAVKRGYWDDQNNFMEVDE